MSVGTHLNKFLITVSQMLLLTMGFPSIVRCSISLIFDHQLSDLERKVNAVNQYTWPCLPLHLGGIELLESNGIFSSAHDQNGVAYRSAS